MMHVAHVHGVLLALGVGIVGIADVGGAGGAAAGVRRLIHRGVLVDDDGGCCCRRAGVSEAGGQVVTDARMPQPVRVEHQAYAGQCHRKSCNHWAEQPSGEGVEHTCRDRDADDVVSEGPRIVLTDIAHGRVRQVDEFQHAAQIAAHQRDIRRLHGHIRAGADGDAKIGLRQGRGVVDAVADHRNQFVVALVGITLRLQAFNPIRLAIWPNLCDNRIDTDLLGDLAGDLGFVAAEHDGAHTGLAQGRNRLL